MRNSLNTKGYFSIWFLTIALLFPTVGRAQTQGSGRWIEPGPKQTIFNFNRANHDNAIVQRYRQEANRLDGDARIYAVIAEDYRKSLTLQKKQRPVSRQVAAIFEALAGRFRKEAQERRDLADMHESIAQFLRRQGLPIEGDAPRREEWVD